ncbi:ATP-binding cassette domain-containing protein [Variovorax sp. PCZ-1]|uniref:ABC transporter ATP-binding protein n=1 Tax=Variovorax sp. PCZ-1 TaxID=2835533 RepID=UPI001BCF0BFD|nr:ATP-binding cassette domain-containing protein [Variovorax sp. PCZ-1]MBS7807146.1 ATP-binding cassette domain-containing protein [Variovorax sp. PCZ-1]
MSKTAPVLISLKDVSMQLGRVQALQGLNFSIAQGEAVALVGANGSGKSTLLRLMQGLIQPTQGSVTQADLAAQAFVFQKPWMLRTTVLANVALAAWLRGSKWSDAKQAATEALQQVDLLTLAQHPARTLSGGQQQRLAVARACVSQPRLLLLDEPTASLAPASKRELEALMASFKSQGMTLIFSSHNLGQVKRLATRVIALDQGAVVFDGHPDAFFAHSLPEHLL